MEKKIVHGNSNFGYAPINVSADTGEATFGTPVMMPGMRSSTMEVEQENTPIYADNIKYVITQGAKVRSAEVGVLYVPKDYAIMALGMKEEANGMLVDTGVKKAHCIFFESKEIDATTGAETQTLHYLYDVLASEPTKETTTDEEEVEPQEIALPFECKESQIAKDSEGKAVQYGYITRTDENASVYDLFKSSVILPTDVI